VFVKRNWLISRVLITVLLAITGFVSFSYSSSFQYSSDDGNNALQKQLTRKLTEVGGVWVKVKVVSGVISLLSTIQIEGSVPVIGGLAVAAEPLGWTDVIDNTLDYISNICLWAMGAIVIQKILLAISMWLTMKFAILFCAFFIILAIWNQRYRAELIKKIFGFVFIFAGICSAVPLSLELSNAIETGILSNYIQGSIDKIDGKSDEAEKVGEDFNNSSLIDKLKNIGKNVSSFFEGIKKTIDDFIDTMINYIMCFIITNILIPIGTLFGLKYFIGTVLKIIGFSGTTQREIVRIEPGSSLS
jgi:hypothetical protein